MLVNEGILQELRVIQYSVRSPCTMTSVRVPSPSLWRLQAISNALLNEKIIRAAEEYSLRWNMARVAYVLLTLRPLEVPLWQETMIIRSWDGQAEHRAALLKEWAATTDDRRTSSRSKRRS